MEKILDFLEKTHRTNWLLFTVCLAVVNTFVFCIINGEFWNYDIKNHHPFFLFLEIALLSTGLTRILVAINFLHWVQLCPVIADVINWCWWERKRKITLFHHRVEIYCNKNKYINFYLLLNSINYGLLLNPESIRKSIEKHFIECTNNRTLYDYTNAFNQDLFGNKEGDFTVPIYIIRECDKKTLWFLPTRTLVAKIEQQKTL